MSGLPSLLFRRLADGGSRPLPVRSVHCSPATFSMMDYFRRKKESSATKVVEKEEAESPVFSLEDEGRLLTEEEIEMKRNKSGLPEWQRRRVNGQVPDLVPFWWTHHTVLYKRKLYGRYGESSGVNPGLLWPTKAELRQRLEYEKVCHPFTIQEMVRRKQERKEAERKEFIRREKEIEDNMQKLQKYKDALKQKGDEKERLEAEATARKDRLMEEVRRHFGYTVDHRDAKFQEMLAKKEKEQRRAMKEARKLEKQQKMLDRLEGKDPKEKALPTKATKKEDKDDDDD